MTKENPIKFHQPTFKSQLNRIIFGTDTPAGRNFDLVLIYLILLSVLALILDSVTEINQQYGTLLHYLEWAFTALFTVEYLLRIYCAHKPWTYIRSFYGIVDLISILPSYLAFLIPGANYLLIIRFLRVLRIFRVLKLLRYLSEANILMRSLLQSRRKIFIFFSVVLGLATVFGSLMFVIEGPANGFTSIPISIYWAVITITTVGYGDITPHTPLGQALATLVMVTGYSVIAVPTGIITAELSHEMQRTKTIIRCPNCTKSSHDNDANYCKYCSAQLNSKTMHCDTNL